jgi:hypothetical protein
MIKANGGNGGVGTVPVQNAQGGGGSGGGIHLIAPTIKGTGTLQAIGGAGTNVAAGAAGRIRLDAFQQQLTGNVNPTPSFGTPYNVPLPINIPSVRVLSVGGIAVPSTPNGSFTPPDIVLNQSAAVTVVIEAENVPPGSIVKVYLFSESAADQYINSTPLAGTLQKSTATASVKFPPGFSRSFVRVTWKP